MGRFKLKVGKTSVRTTGYMSEASFVKQINAGMRSIEKDVQYIMDQFEDVTPEIMYDALKPTFDKTQERVPKRTNALANSGYLEIVERRGKPTVELGYAKGGYPDYAVYVHEMLEIPHRAPTSAKFVEGPVNEDLGDIIDRITSAYRDFMSV